MHPTTLPTPPHTHLPNLHPPAGNCGYGYLDPRAKTGWDVAALSDTAGDFAGSCGRCYEVACLPLVREGREGEGVCPMILVLGASRGGVHMGVMMDRQC